MISQRGYNDKFRYFFLKIWQQKALKTNNELHIIFQIPGLAENKLKNNLINLAHEYPFSD